MLPQLKLCCDPAVRNIGNIIRAVSTMSNTHDACLLLVWIDAIIIHCLSPTPSHYYRNTVHEFIQIYKTAECVINGKLTGNKVKKQTSRSSAVKR